MDRATMLGITSRKDDRNRPVPFSIRWISFDRNRRNKPSRHLHEAKATRCGAAHDLHRHGQISIQPVKGGHPIPIHIDLITELNGEKVI